MNSLLFLSLTTINKHNLFLRNFKSVSVQIFSSGSHTEREATGRTKGMYKDENLTLYGSKITSLLIEKKRYRKINNVWLLGRQDFHKNVPNSNWNVIPEALDKKRVAINGSRRFTENSSLLIFNITLL